MVHLIKYLNRYNQKLFNKDFKSIIQLSIVFNQYDIFLYLINDRDYYLYHFSSEYSFKQSTIDKTEKAAFVSWK